MEFIPTGKINTAVSGDLLVDQVSCAGEEDDEDDDCRKVGKTCHIFKGQRQNEVEYHGQNGKQYDQQDKSDHTDDHIKKSRVHS